MKKLLLSFCMILLVSLVFGQARDGTTEYNYNANKQPAALIYLPYSPNVVSSAILHYKNEGYNVKDASSKMYESFQNTSLIQDNISVENLTFKIGYKDLQNKNITAVYLMLETSLLESTVYDDYRPRTVHFLDMDQAIAFLNNLAVAIQSYASNKQIIQQTNDLALATIKQSKLVKIENKLNNRQNDLHQKFTGLDTRNGIKRNEKCERRISVNTAAQAMLQDAITKQKQDLMVLSSQQTKLQ